jgi:hypothetical protein
MTARTDLVWLGVDAEPPAWPPGEVIRAGAEPRALREVIDPALERSRADAWLFWDSSLVPPRPDTVLEMLAHPGDIWHAGLALGLGGAPRIIDFISPTWTFNRDPDASCEATSWRVSLRACLVRTSVLRWRKPRADFETLDAASLEWGHHCITHGALPRHAPSLLPAPPRNSAPVLSLADEMRFARALFDTRWVAWAAIRAAIAADARFEDIADAWLASRPVARSSGGLPFQRVNVPARTAQPVVSVLVPTLDRYEHLRVLLSQLRTQTVPAAEIIVVDQTPVERRDAKLGADFADLPLRVVELSAPGQCSSRNAGLALARGDAILFVDDDDEISPDLIARHVQHLDSSGADVSSGVAQEPSSGTLPESFKRPRASDVFPTNNTLARRVALERSGLFDLAYEHGARADGDLGMRVYLAGTVMMLNPDISVLHHHAPRGGLRTHGARVVTYAGSRRRIRQRQLPEVTELYRTMRYFSERQLRESLAQSALGTFSAHGGAARRWLKMLYGAVMLPLTLMQLRRRVAGARAMLERFPQIPAFPPRPR